MASKSDGRPRHQQIAAEIRASIMAGDLHVGAKLPSTRGLEVQFGVTSRTVQGALQILKDEGLVEGQKGHGVFVLAKKPHIVDVSVTSIAPTSDGYSTVLLGVSEVRPPGDVAELLELPEDGVAVMRNHLVLHGGQPTELDQSYYPVEIAHGTVLERRGKVPADPSQLLAEAGHAPRSFVDRVSVRPPTTDELIALELPESVQVICQTRVVYSGGDRPVAVSILIKPGHLYELRYRQSLP